MPARIARAAPHREKQAVEIPDEPPLPTAPRLRQYIIDIFSDAQRSTAGHRKLIVRLRKIQEICCGLHASEKKGRRVSVAVEDYEQGEKDFNTEIARCVLRVLPVKKSEGTGDRVIRFLGVFLPASTEKGESISHWKKRHLLTGTGRPRGPWPN